MGYKKAEKHIIAVGCSSSNPADSTEYRFFYVNEPLTAPVLRSYILLPNVIFTRIDISFITTASYSDEDVTLLLRDDNSAVDYTIANFTKVAVGGNYAFINEDINIPLNSKRVQFKIVTPAWATNPLNVKIYGTLEYINL